MQQLGSIIFAFCVLIHSLEEAEELKTVGSTFSTVLTCKAELTLSKAIQ